MTEVLKLGHKPKRLDLDVLENGLRREAPMAPGTYWTVLPWGTHNKRYRKALQVRAMRERAQSNGRRSAEEVGEDEARDYILGKQEDPEFIVDAVLMRFEGVLNSNGNEVKYTRERALQILSDPEWVHLRDWIVGVSYQAANTYRADVEDAEKN